MTTTFFVPLGWGFYERVVLLLGLYHIIVLMLVCDAIGSAYSADSS